MGRPAGSAAACSGRAVDCRFVNRRCDRRPLLHRTWACAENRFCELVSRGGLGPFFVRLPYCWACSMVSSSASPIEQRSPSIGDGGAVRLLLNPTGTTGLACPRDAQYNLPKIRLRLADPLPSRRRRRTRRCVRPAAPTSVALDGRHLPHAACRRQDRRLAPALKWANFIVVPVASATEPGRPARQAHRNRQPPEHELDPSCERGAQAGIT